MTRGELVGATVGGAAAVPPALGVGNANVADGDVEGVADAVGDGDGEGLGVGVGRGGMMSSQWCSGTLAPPISLTSASQRA